MQNAHMRVDGPLARGLWPPVGGGLCRRVVKGKVLRMDRPRGRRVLRFDGAFGPEGCGIARRAMSFISRLRRSRQHRVSILSAYLVHPFPLRGTSPQGETRALRDWLFVSYGMISILRIGSLRSPPPIRLRRTSPCSGGRIKHLEASLRKQLCSKHGLLCPRLRGWQRNWIHRGAVGDPRIQ